MKAIQYLDWRRPTRNMLRGGAVYRNGKPTTLAAVRILTVFGFGVCIYDRYAAHNTALANHQIPRLLVSFGFFEFRTDYTAMRALHSLME